MDGKGAYAHLEFLIPARGLIGLRTRLMSATQGEAIMHHNFHDYRPLKGEIPSRGNGVMVSMARGQAVGFSLDNLQQRGIMFVQPGDNIYEGMIIGENARSDDMVVNPCKEKKLTNMRASGSDKNILLKPPRLLTLEIALEYIESDELVEITPSKIRLRKKVLTEEGRKRSSAGAARRSAFEFRRPLPSFRLTSWTSPQQFPIEIDLHAVAPKRGMRLAGQLHAGQKQQSHSHDRQRRGYARTSLPIRT